MPLQELFKSALADEDTEPWSWRRLLWWAENVAGVGDEAQAAKADRPSVRGETLLGELAKQLDLMPITSRASARLSIDLGLTLISVSRLNPHAPAELLAAIEGVRIVLVKRTADDATFRRALCLSCCDLWYRSWFGIPRDEQSNPHLLQMLFRDDGLAIGRLADSLVPDLRQHLIRAALSGTDMRFRTRTDASILKAVGAGPLADEVIPSNHAAVMCFAWHVMQPDLHRAEDILQGRLRARISKCLARTGAPLKLAMVMSTLRLLNSGRLSSGDLSRRVWRRLPSIGALSENRPELLFLVEAFLLLSEEHFARSLRQLADWPPRAIVNLAYRCSELYHLGRSMPEVVGEFLYGEIGYDKIEKAAIPSNIRTRHGLDTLDKALQVLRRSPRELNVFRHVGSIVCARPDASGKSRRRQTSIGRGTTHVEDVAAIYVDEAPGNAAGPPMRAMARAWPAESVRKCLSMLRGQGDERTRQLLEHCRRYVSQPHAELILLGMKTMWPPGTAELLRTLVETSRRLDTADKPALIWRLTGNAAWRSHYPTASVDAFHSVRLSSPHGRRICRCDDVFKILTFDAVAGNCHHLVRGNKAFGCVEIAASASATTHCAYREDGALADFCELRYLDEGIAVYYWKYSPTCVAPELWHAYFEQYAKECGRPLLYPADCMPPIWGRFLQGMGYQLRNMELTLRRSVSDIWNNDEHTGVSTFDNDELCRFAASCYVRERPVGKAGQTLRPVIRCMPLGVGHLPKQAASAQDICCLLLWWQQREPGILTAIELTQAASLLTAILEHHEPAPETESFRPRVRAMACEVLARQHGPHRISAELFERLEAATHLT